MSSTIAVSRGERIGACSAGHRSRPRTAGRVRHTLGQQRPFETISSHPAVARLLEEGIEDCLACLAFPLAHRARIRTTNGLERLHEEIKRRTRVVRIFPNPEACLRLVTAFCVEQSEEWVSGRRYLDMAHQSPPIAEGARPVD
jgi:transposase-like protein